jgi:hypothetical protein
MKIAEAHRTPGATRALALDARDLAILPMLLLGALLRLWNLGSSVFLSDEAGIYTLAQGVVAHHALAVTGLISSIGVYNPPGAIYLYLPFVLLRDPIVGAYATAVANVIAIALAYYFGRQYLGYIPALIGALLFAVSAWPVYYSRFIWQQNLLPPFVMWFILLIAAAIAGKRSRWLAWALPLWGLMIQLHPTALVLGLLIPFAWLLSPRKAPIRDLLIGIAALIVLYIPTILWEVTSHFYDLHALQAYGHQPAHVDLAALRQFLTLSGLPAWVPWQGTRAYTTLLALSWTIAVVGLIYLLARVLWPALAALRASVTAGRRLAHPRQWIAWLHAPAQCRWRIDLLLIVWPALFLLTQLDHRSPVYPYYMLGTLPSQFLATGILVSDLVRLQRPSSAIPSVPWPFRARIPKGRARAGTWPFRQRSGDSAPGRLPGRISLPHWPVRRVLLVAPVLAALLLLVDVGVQIAATPVWYPRLDTFSLAAEKAGFIQAERIVRRNHIALVVIQPGFFTIDPVNYLLQNGYAPGAPTRVVMAGTCLTVAPPGGTTLYLMAGPITTSELYISHLPGITNVFAGTPASGFFRAYIVPSATLSAHLAPLDMGSSAPLNANFDNQMALQHVWQATGIGSKPVLTLAYDLIAPVPGRPFDVSYNSSVQLFNRAGQALGGYEQGCAMQPWTPGQRVYLFYPGAARGMLTRVARIVVSASRSQYTIPPTTLGPLPLETAYTLAIGHYYLPKPSAIPLPAVQCSPATSCESSN